MNGESGADARTTPDAVAPAVEHAKRVARAVVEAAQHLDPARLVSAEPELTAPPALISVYRHRNAPVLRKLVDQLPPGSVVRLWALDRTAPALSDHTVGTGPGDRLDLLNALIGALEGTTYGPLVITDDDVSFVIGDLTRLLALGGLLELDLFQPAHSRRSKTAHRFCRKRWLVVGRRTTFVEEGPLLVLTPAAQARVLPFPDDFGMGWGIEVRWYRCASELRMGIVDAVVMRHERDGSYTYDTGPERARLRAELEAVGLRELREIQRELGRRWVVDRRGGEPRRSSPGDRL